MQTIIWFKNFIVTAVTIVGLELAGSSPAGAAETIGQHGYWTAILDTGRDGQGICGVRTQMTNGAELRLVVIGDEVHLVAYDPTWTMPADGEARVAINVDGEVYNGKAVAADARTLVVHNLTADFVEDFLNGLTMEANFGGARWTVSLVGSSRAAIGMGGCVAAAHRGLVS